MITQQLDTPGVFNSESRPHHPSRTSPVTSSSRTLARAPRACCFSVCSTFYFLLGWSGNLQASYMLDQQLGICPFKFELTTFRTLNYRKAGFSLKPKAIVNMTGYHLYLILLVKISLIKMRCLAMSFYGWGAGAGCRGVGGSSPGLEPLHYF